MPTPYSNPWADYAKNLSPLSSAAFEADPATGWDAFSSVAGDGQSSGFQKWLQGQFGTYRADWTKQLGLNPFKKWVDYLGEIDPKSGEQGYDWMDPFFKNQRPGSYAPTMGMRVGGY